ncbi:MAG: hypothetical protein JXB48_20105 [Candidatus Latescibacteria bacterium]|nr:hypothetical protein [Candidatus Latescibacterota bacterium]
MYRLKAIIMIAIISFIFIPSAAWSLVHNFGFGFILGEPTGFSMKTMLNEDVALDIGTGWSFGKESHFHMHADLLHHNWDLLQDHFRITEGQLPIYYGIGGRIKLGDETKAGVRLVVGISYLFEDSPLDAFFEIAPIMDVAPKTKLTGNAALGLRYWF